MNALALVLLLSTAQVDLPMPPPPTPKKAATPAKPKPASETKPAATTPPPGSTAPATSAEPARPARAEPAATVQQGRRLPPIDVGATIGPMMMVNAPTSGMPPYFRIGARVDFRLLQHDRIGVSAGAGLGLSGSSGTISALGQSFRYSATMFDFYPSGRATFSVMPDVGLYAELGLLMGYAGATIQQMYVGNVSAGGGGAGLRLALGVEWRMTPAIALLIEPMALSVFSSSYTQNGVTQNNSATTWGLFIGGSYRL